MSIFYEEMKTADDYHEKKFDQHQDREHDDEKAGFRDTKKNNAIHRSNNIADDAIRMHTAREKVYNHDQQKRTSGYGYSKEDKYRAVDATDRHLRKHPVKESRSIFY